MAEVEIYLSLFKEPKALLATQPRFLLDFGYNPPQRTLRGPCTGHNATRRNGAKKNTATTRNSTKSERRIRQMNTSLNIKNSAQNFFTGSPTTP